LTKKKKRRRSLRKKSIKSQPLRHPLVMPCCQKDLEVGCASHASLKMQVFHLLNHLLHVLIIFYFLKNIYIYLKTKLSSSQLDNN